MSCWVRLIWLRPLLCRTVVHADEPVKTRGPQQPSNRSGLSCLRHYFTRPMKPTSVCPCPAPVRSPLPMPYPLLTLFCSPQLAFFFLFCRYLHTRILCLKFPCDKNYTPCSQNFPHPKSPKSEIPEISQIISQIISQNNPAKFLFLTVHLRSFRTNCQFLQKTLAGCSAVAYLRFFIITNWGMDPLDGILARLPEGAWQAALGGVILGGTATTMLAMTGGSPVRISNHWQILTLSWDSATFQRLKVQSSWIAIS